MRWLFPGMEVCIDSRCLDCGEPLQVKMRDHVIVEVNPATIVGHVNIPFTRRGEFTDAYR